MAIQSGASEGLRELSLFAGAGGGILGGKLLGWRTVCAVERDAYAAQVLAQRQNDGILEPFPIWSDVTSFDGKPWRGIVDVVSGGFPCQDISNAGNGAGINGPKSGLWTEFKRIIRDVDPEYVSVENSPTLTSRGLDRVLADLAALGFDAEWGCISASSLGAAHKRDRIWICAYANGNGLQERVNVRSASQEAPGGKHEGGAPDRVLTTQDDTDPKRGQLSLGWAAGRIRRFQQLISRNRGWEVEAEPTLDRGVDGLADRLDRLKAIGNGQVPIVAATAWEVLTA